jgi:hypothetical protein
VSTVKNCNALKSLVYKEIINCWIVAQLVTAERSSKAAEDAYPETLTGTRK